MVFNFDACLTNAKWTRLNLLANIAENTSTQGNVSDEEVSGDEEDKEDDQSYSQYAAAGRSCLCSICIPIPNVYNNVYFFEWRDRAIFGRCGAQLLR